MKELMKSIANYAAVGIKKCKKFFKEIKKTFKEAFSSSDAVDADENNVDVKMPNPFDVMGSVCVDETNKILNKFGKKFKNKNKAESMISKIASTALRVICIALTAVFLFNVISTIVKIAPIVLKYTVTVFAICAIVKFTMIVVNFAFSDETTQAVNA